MRGINKVILFGNVGRTPELRYTPEGRPVCSFSLASARTFLDAHGERQEEIERHKVVAFGKLAEVCGQFLEKGRPLYVEGRLHTRQWTTKDGEARSTTEVLVDTVQLLNTQSRTLQELVPEGDFRIGSGNTFAEFEG